MRASVFSQPRQSVLTDSFGSVIRWSKTSVSDKVATDWFSRERETDNFGFGLLGSVFGFNQDILIAGVGLAGWDRGMSCRTAARSSPPCLRRPSALAAGAGTHSRTTQITMCVAPSSSPCVTALSSSPLICTWRLPLTRAAVSPRSCSQVRIDRDLRLET